MSGFCIPLSSNQICQTICESYNRLINNYVGPLCTSSCFNSGFLIKDGRGGCGLFVGNSGYNFAKNCISFINNCDVSITYPSGANFTLNPRSSSPIVFWSNAGLSLGSTRLLRGFNGLQIWNNNPSIILTDLDCFPNHNLSFRNCLGLPYFEINQNSVGTDIIGLQNIKFLSRSSKVLELSGNKIAINSNISNCYNLNFSGDSLFSGGNYLFNGNTCFSGLTVINEGNNCTGNSFVVNSCSLFAKPAVFCESLNAKRFCSDEIFGASVSSTNASFFNLNINNTLTSPRLFILDSAFFCKDVNYFQSSGCCLVSNFSTLGNANAQCLTVCNLNLSGYFNTFTTGLQSSTSCISAIIANCCIDIRSPIIKYTGTITGINSLHTCNIYSWNTGSSFNACISCLNSLCNNSTFLTYTSGSGTFGYLGDLNVENRVSASNFLQTCSSSNIFFNTDCFVIGTNNPVTIKCGEILNSKNTLKSFGVVCFSGCSLACYTGYNLKSLSLGSTLSGNPFCCGNCSSVFVINFSDPIKYPFSTSFTSILDPSSEFPTGIASSDPLKETVAEICQSRNPQFNLMFCGSTSCASNASWSSWDKFCNNCYYHSIAVILTTVDYCFTPISNRMFNFTILGQT
jgi:hypothetical protein